MIRVTFSPPRRPVVLALCLAAAGLLLPAAGAEAQDWPSWRGRAQTGVSELTGLPSSWSVDGENLVWFQPYIARSTPAVFDGRVCANGRTGEDVEKKEIVTCWNADDGTELWEHTFSVLNTTVPYNRVGWGSVTGDPETGYLYALNVDGHLHAFDREGEIVWSWRLHEDLGRASGYGGRTSTPVIDEDRLILSVIGSAWGDLGGPPRHRYVAFNKANGNVEWVSTPGGQPADMNTQSVPIIAVVNGQRLIIDGNADGHIYALQARTGKKIWEFHLSQRGINVSPVIDGNTVYVAHSEENIDVGTMGRVVALDATREGDITETGEVWRINELAVGFSSPLIHEGRLYLIDNSANLYAIDASDGTVLWEESVGNVGKSSPVWADGKLYVTEVNGNVHILQPGDDGVEFLDSDELEVEGGRYAEIYGSFAPAYGRLYVTAESGIYCIGDPDAAFAATPGETPPLGAEADAAGTVASIQVHPAEVIASAGETLRFRVEAFDANGRSLGPRDATWSLDGLTGARLRVNGEFQSPPQSANDAGRVIATVGNVSGAARVRIFSPLPWAENFEGGRPGHWIGGGGSLAAVDEGGEQLFRKGPSRTGIHRHAIYIGPSRMSNYTVQADAMSTEKGRRRPDIGLINSGYTMDLQGNHQRIEVRSWAAELRMAERFDFAWDPNVWYTLKLRVDTDADRALIRGKVWPRGEAEPEAWTVTVEDPQPVRNGSPGLIGYSPIDIYYDNVRVMENQ
ncbi:MAG: PQQ-binding-like beta-propeller repeat protein [Acidobacteria bacterium]|nr:PQQ-binding-like beta-propeller repeat protein [Acidobacteriota bacterium]